MPFFIGATGLGIGLIVSSLLLGLRHGVDWDHIAAITDIAATQDSPRRGFALGIVYAFGHGLVVGSLSPWGGVNRYETAPPGAARTCGGASGPIRTRTPELDTQADWWGAPSVSERSQRAGDLTPNP